MSPEDQVEDLFSELFVCDECGISLVMEQGEDQSPHGDLSDDAPVLALVCTWCYEDELLGDQADASGDTAG